MIELLAGIPSVVYGFWGLVVLTPLIRAWQPPGQSLLAAMLILGDHGPADDRAPRRGRPASVPRAYLDGAAALGLSRWATIRGVALPAARGAIVTAVVLATGRAFGETMAVLMVSGNVVQVPGSVFDPVRVLTANIALELGYALGDHRSALFVSGLLLMTVAVRPRRHRTSRRCRSPPCIALRPDRCRGACAAVPAGATGWLTFVMWAVALGITALFLAILAALLRGGAAGLSWRFLVDSPRDAGRAGGIGPILVSTLGILVVCLAASAAARHRHRDPARRVLARHRLVGRLVRASLDVLAAVPSIVFGLFGNAFFSLFLGLGFSILAGGLTLACMVLPLLIRSTEEALRAVPDDYRAAAAALGLSRTRDAPAHSAAGRDAGVRRRAGARRSAARSPRPRCCSSRAATSIACRSRCSIRAARCRSTSTTSR